MNSYPPRLAGLDGGREYAGGCWTTAGGTGGDRLASGRLEKDAECEGKCDEAAGRNMGEWLLGRE